MSKTSSTVIKQECCEECAICMETLDSEKNFAKTNCKHAFCLSCLVKALKNNNTCPLCRANIEEDKPKKGQKITFEEAIEVAKDEIDMFSLNDYVDAIIHFDNPKSIIKNMLRIYSIGLVRSILSYQDDLEDDEWHEEEETDNQAEAEDDEEDEDEEFDDESDADDEEWNEDDD